MDYRRALGWAGAPLWARVLTDAGNLIWCADEEEHWRVKTARLILLLNACLMLGLSLWIVSVTGIGLGQAVSDRDRREQQRAIMLERLAGDHYRLEQLTREFEKLDVEKRLVVNEEVLRQHTERLSSIEGILRWVAIGVAGVLGKSVLETLVAVGLRRKKPEESG
jgi:hypothetical protein